MKKVIKILLASIFIISFIFINFANAAVSVSGYYKKNGTYVQPHMRSNPDGNPYNNYSYPGNLNPYTGKIAPGNASTYLNNYYGSSSSSSSYGTSYTSPYTSSYYNYVSPYTYSGYSSGSTTQTIEGGYYIGTSLFCNSDYYKSGSSCIKAPANSTALYTDFMCNSGYYENGNGCEKVPDGGYSTVSGFECNSGYVKRGNQCFKPSNGYISGTTMYCNTGYVINSTKDDCISYDYWCLNALGGINAGYDSAKKECSCTGNTVYNGSLCVDASAQCRQVYGNDSYGDKDFCYCSPGYEFNSTKTLCLKTVTCNAGEVKVDGKCLTQDQSCKSTYGDGSFSQGNLCYCSSGYSWSSDLKSCTTGTKPINSKQLKVGSKGSDVVNLHNFLAQQSLYSGKVDSPFSKETSKAVSEFQKKNSIPSNGLVSQKTLLKINSSILGN